MLLSPLRLLLFRRRSVRPSRFERYALVTVAILSGIHAVGSCLPGDPGPVPGWTTYTYEGLKLSVPRSWTVRRRNVLFDHVDGIYAYAPGRRSPGNDRMSLYLSVERGADRAGIYEAADGEARQLDCGETDARRPALITDASITGAWGLTVERPCAGPLSLTALVLSGGRTFTIRLNQDAEDAADAATLRQIVQLLAVA